MSAPEYRCPKCGSRRLYHFRMDADWGTGGDLNRLNGPEHYKDGDPKDRHDIDIAVTICARCEGWNRI